MVHAGKLTQSRVFLIIEGCILDLEIFQYFVFKVDLVVFFPGTKLLLFEVLHGLDEVHFMQSDLLYFPKVLILLDHDVNVNGNAGDDAA